MKVNDILINSYYYAGISNRFWLVINVSKTGKTARIKEYRGKVVEHDGYGHNGTGTETIDMESPTDNYCDIRINDEGVGRHKGESYYKWDGKPVRFMCD